MLFFPNAKINIGLNIVEKRNDGFHNLETVFYPIGLKDSLEFVETKNSETHLQTTGIDLDVDNKDNICYKAYSLMANNFDIPKLNIHLHKIIPTGAGLGGGSADAAFLIKEISNYFNLNINSAKLESLAAEIGSDCAFFIKNKPVFAFDRGEKFQEITLDLSNYYIYLIKPQIFVSTADAFSGIKPQKPQYSINDLINKPIEEWKDYIFNDFEQTIFNKYPLIDEIKSSMYDMGAVYASMSGSGSAVYGIFKNKPEVNIKYDKSFNWIGKL